MRQVRIIVLLLAGLLTPGMPSAIAQSETEEPTVYRARILPHWQPDATSFWYRNDGPHETRDFVWVDAEAGRRRPAFDHAAIAAALSVELDRPVEARRLPIDAIRLLDGEILLVGPEESWIWSVDDRRLRVASTTEIPTEGLPFDAVISDRPPDAGGAVSDPPKPATISPDNRWEVFVRGHDLQVRDRENGTVRPLSFDASAGNSFRRNVQRIRGIGMRYDTPAAPPSIPGRIVWSPDSRYVVAVQTRTVPERRVTVVEARPEEQTQPLLRSYPYFKAGDEIPTQQPRLFDVTDGREIVFPSELFSNPWEISHIRWAPGADRFTFLYNRRGHGVMRVIEVAVDAEGDAGVAVVVDETSDTFIDYSSKTFLHIVEDHDSMFWMSERSGWNHLYRIDVEGRTASAVTSGEWVVREVEHVDESAKQIWFHAGGIHADQDPYYRQLARVDFDGTGLTVLTRGDGTHDIQWSPDRRFFIDSWSRVDRPPVHELRRATDGELVTRLEEADASEVLSRRGSWPERFAAPGRDGKTAIYGIIHRPPNFDLRQRYPVVELIYAGPHGFWVPKRFSDRYPTIDALTARGFVVVQIDGMGTNWRSKAFHDVCWKNLGDAGFPDRIAWMRAAAGRRPFMDLDRVGIFGSSAGGQNAMRALIAHGDFYDVAVADCGCHDNRMDKIWWSEAWMGWPVGPHYSESSNVDQAHRLEGKLMLIVGALDRNVDPASTLQVADALVAADKDFDLVLLPGAGHGAADTPYGERRMLDFLTEELRKLRPPSDP